MQDECKGERSERVTLLDSAAATNDVLTLGDVSVDSPTKPSVVCLLRVKRSKSITTSRRAAPQTYHW